MFSVVGWKYLIVAIVGTGIAMILAMLVGFI